MKKKIIFTALLSLTIFCFFNFAYADTTIHLTIKTPTSTMYDNDITVTPCNSDNGVTTNTDTTAYCAILQSGLANNWSWYGTGAFLNSIGTIAGYTSKDVNNNDVYHYWDWSLNGTEGAIGLNEYELKPSDLISLNFIDPQTTPTPVVGDGGGQLYNGSTTPPAINTPNTTTNNTDSTSSPQATTTPATPLFDPKKAMDFLTAQQNKDGSFSADLYTDWTAMALASSANNQTQTIKLIKYYEESKLTNPTLTDYERRAMALMALGLSPYDTNGENYINDIVKSFDGKQFGDGAEDNDDIFALIVLQNAGYTQNDSMISTDLNFILSKQNTDGSWDNSVDMTGATMEALSVFNQENPLLTFPLAGGEKISDALTKAENYLEQKQKDDGSWNDNASSTTWAMEGILAQNEKPEDWASSQSKKTPLDYLATLQDTDGGVKNSDLNTKIWETAYVTSALSGKTWNQIMQSFDKEDLTVPVLNLPMQTTTPPTTENTNTVSIKNTENKIVKKENSIKQNVATILNTTTLPISIPTTTPQKNWFEKLFAKIF